MSHPILKDALSNFYFEQTDTVPQSDKEVQDYLAKLLDPETALLEDITAYYRSVADFLSPPLYIVPTSNLQLH